MESTNFKPKLILRHFISATDAGEDVALFVPAKTKRGINCYRALILEDCNFVAGERLSLFPHKGLNPKIRKRLEELKKQTAEILAKRQLENNARYTSMKEIAAKLAEIERREKGLPPEPSRSILVYSGTTGDDEPEEPADEPNGGDDQDG